jgi:hypothetical protein
MALQLIIDNTDYHNWLGNLVRAVYHDPKLPMPADLQALVLRIDADEVEEHMRAAIKLGIAK